MCGPPDCIIMYRLESLIVYKMLSKFCLKIGDMSNNVAVNCLANIIGFVSGSVSLTCEVRLLD